ncbi:MAG: MBL fold metallo-hydrolase [Treponema sp.]|jgi:glyoxylase-like metal-dependent hydrolase (beta-lactamase superfamily II)|nr:MBL fold metallo-hydrolase [Treponema sp.]
MNNNINQLVVGAIATNCWIYRIDTDGNAAVIDPGDEGQVIISALKDLALVPKYILLTHGHFDHIAALHDLAEAFPSAEIAIHQKDAEYLGPDSYKAHSLSIKAAMGTTLFINALWPASKKGLPSPGRLLNEGDTIGPFTVLHLPGHTPGSTAFWDKEAGILFTGDTLFKSGYGRTDLPGGNEQELVASLRRLFALDPNIAVCPGHGGATTIGREA